MFYGVHSLYLNLDREYVYVRFNKESYIKFQDNSSDHSMKVMNQLSIMVDEQKSDYLRDPVGCRIYLAESSIPNSGLGMFSGVNIQKGDRIGYDELPVAIFDIISHSEMKDADQWHIGNYQWDPDSRSLKLGEEAILVTAMIPGINSAANGYPDMQKHVFQSVNVIGYERPKYSDLQAGASNEYNSVRFIATKAMPQGIEILVQYHDQYTRARDDLKDIPLQIDYVNADYFAKEFLNHISSSQYSSLTQEDRQKFWIMKRSLLEEKVQSVLPVDVTYVEDVVKNGSALFSLLPDVIRTPEWLKANGQCMDNIVSRPSKVQYAGMGAFATRYISKNSLVAPLPLIILNKTLLLMYELEYDEDELNPPTRTNKVVSHQLLLNYCFSHVDSSLAFFPYSSGVQFINHSSEKTNAELRWSNHHHHKSSWLNLPPKELLKKKSGLMLDIIATRDIYPGDEIYIDYGSDWQQAWNTHVSKWKLRKKDHYPPQAIRPLKLYRYTLLTVLELKLQPYSDDKRTVCRIPAIREVQKNGKTNLKMYYGVSDSNYHIVECDILERKKSDEYTALVYLKFKIVIHGIPDNSICISGHAKNINNNQAKKDAFRHFITIPNELFPLQWKDNVSEQ